MQFWISVTAWNGAPPINEMLENEISEFIKNKIKSFCCQWRSGVGPGPTRLKKIIYAPTPGNAEPQLGTQLSTAHSDD
jgi:hypothetical protein